MCAFLIVSAAIRELGWIFSRRDRQSGFVSGIALAQNHKPDVVGKQSIQQGHENVETFFAHNARHHSKNWSTRFLIKAQPVEKRAAAQFLSPKFARSVIRR